jgi:HSP20 family protein
MSSLRRIVHALQSGFDCDSGAAWRPPADVYRVKGGWLVKLDLAGIRVEEVQVQVEESRLTVCGERRDATIREVDQAYSMEISYNRFARSIELPCDIRNAVIRTQYQDGMLSIYLITEPAS